MSSLVRFYTLVRRFIYAVAAALFFIFFLWTFGCVVARYVFNSPILVGDEIKFYLFCYLAILAVYYAYGARSHISVDLITSLFPQRMQAWLRVLTAIFEQIVWAIILWQGISGTYILITRTHILEPYTMRMPVAVTFVVVPITSFFVLIDNTLSSVIPEIKALRRK